MEGEAIIVGKEIKTLRVAGNSQVKKVAGSITKCLEEGFDVEAYTIGAGACNQCAKAIAMARGFVATKGRDLVTRIGFSPTIIDGEEKTCIKFVVTIE